MPAVYSPFGDELIVRQGQTASQMLTSKGTQTELIPMFWSHTKGALSLRGLCISSTLPLPRRGICTFNFFHILEWCVFVIMLYYTAYYYMPSFLHRSYTNVLS